MSGDKTGDRPGTPGTRQKRKRKRKRSLLPSSSLSFGSPAPGACRPGACGLVGLAAGGRGIKISVFAFPETDWLVKFLWPQVLGFFLRGRLAWHRHGPSYWPWRCTWSSWCHRPLRHRAVPMPAAAAGMTSGCACGAARDRCQSSRRPGWPAWSTRLRLATLSAWQRRQLELLALALLLWTPSEN
jgi:hypothetical protein